MNLVDLAILAILLLCVAEGYYRGFMTTLITLLGSVVTAFIAFLAYPALASSFKAAGNLIPSILNFSESADMIGSIEIFRQSVHDIDPVQATGLIEILGLPFPLERIFLQNVLNQQYADMGITWFGDYLSMSIAEMAVNVLSFVIIFVFIFLIIALAARLVDYVVDLPMLKYWDGVCGAVLGFLMGVMLIFVLFMGVPVVLAFIPFDMLKVLMDSSQFSQLFYKSNFLLGWLRNFIR